MSKIVFERNSAGIQELLKSSEMQAALEEAAAKKAAEAGEGYEYSTHIGQKRAYINLYPATKEAAYDNYDNNTLERIMRE